MSDLEAVEFEPAYITPEGPLQPTEYGKRWLTEQWDKVDVHWDVIWDILKLARSEMWKWPQIFTRLRAEGVPTAMASGLSGYAMGKAIDYINGKTTTAFAPTTPAMALGTAAPSVTTTGVWGATETTNYGGYTRLAITTTNWTAAITNASPSTATYSSSGAVTFAACTSGSAVELGFLICDTSTNNTGNALWWGPISSVTISTTQTPPTLSTNALQVSLAST